MGVPQAMSDSERAAFHEAIAAIDAAVASLGRLVTGRDAYEAVELAERLRRSAEVALDAVVAEVDDEFLFRDRGFTSVKAMVEYQANLAPGSAARLTKRARLFRSCTEIRDAWHSGDLSVDQVAVLAKGFANPRCRDMFVESQDWFLTQARRCNYRQFELLVARWVRLADTNGVEPAQEPGHRDRDVSMVQDKFSLQWHLRATFGSVHGAQIKEILDAYAQAEFVTDWETATAEHGDHTCVADLARTAAQHRADGFVQALVDGLANPASSAPNPTTHNIAWSADSVEELLRRLAGADPKPFDVDSHRCHSIDGHELDPNAAFADLLVSSFRRVVQNAAGVTIDLSETQRLYTGLARLGVQLSSDTCYWPGCNRPTTQSQIDHLRPAARGGPTTQSNGLPACQHHNRLKERGYTVVRNLTDGTITISTPAGDELTTHPANE